MKHGVQVGARCHGKGRVTYDARDFVEEGNPDYDQPYDDILQDKMVTDLRKKWAYRSLGPKRRGVLYTIVTFLFFLSPLLTELRDPCKLGLKGTMDPFLWYPPLTNVPGCTP
uniref:Uncharacterized protein n=1 Tax=Timema tahoe TaxID=61484 RepID=A0A7R9FNZ6_9NEOP|nr:unnamed protein product [Timema tahoe]